MDLTDLTLWVCGGVIAIGGVANIFNTNKARYKVENQTPIYRDINGDGVPDKIVKRLGEDNSVPFMPSNRDIEEEVLYGVRINGKTIYVTKEQYGESK